MTLDRRFTSRDPYTTQFSNSKYTVNKTGKQVTRSHTNSSIQFWFVVDGLLFFPLGPFSSFLSFFDQLSGPSGPCFGRYKVADRPTSTIWFSVPTATLTSTPT